MRTVAAYLLDRPGLTREEADTRAKAVTDALDTWMRSKGIVPTGDDTGSFASLTSGVVGAYAKRVYRSEKGVLEELRLEESTRGGQRFTTTLYIMALANRLTLFVSLDVANVESKVAPSFSDPRCPSIVRTLIELFPDWELNGTPIGAPTAVAIAGRTAAMDLVLRLEAIDRSLPIVVVSENEGEPVFPNLAESLAYDLSGLAQVISIDDAASWCLTDELGKSNSCYQGAVRLYWPMRRHQLQLGELRSTVWTASRILSSDSDGKGEQRLRSQLRRTVMEVAAISLDIPAAMVELQRSESRRQLLELEATATSQSKELELARLFESDNERLSKELAEVKQSNANLLARLEAAEYALEQRKSDDLDPVPQVLDEASAPAAGEIRFYKKTHSKPNYDVLVRVADCGHTSWQGATKADKAKKGVERLEGTSEWKSIQHCGSCTGGGMWRVKW